MWLKRSRGFTVNCKHEQNIAVYYIMSIGFDGYICLGLDHRNDEFFTDTVYRFIMILFSE